MFFAVAFITTDTNIATTVTHPTALDDIAFLARSPNRVSVLSALADGPRERPELETEVGVSRVTAKRILDDLVERGWVTRAGRTYETTPLGDLVEREFSGFYETMQAANRLQDVITWLPPDGLGFDLWRLGEADITVPTRNNPFAPFRGILEKVTLADDVHELTHSMPPELLAAHHEAVTTHDQTLTIVLEAATLDELAGQPDLVAAVETLLDRGVEVRSYPDEVPLAVCLADGEVGLVLTDSLGLPRAFVETADEEVVEWAASTLEAFAAEATLVDRDTLRS